MYYNPIEAGRRISTLRQEKDLKQEAFAAHFGTTDRHIRRIEKGDTSPSIDLFVEMATYFDTTLDFLIMGVPIGEREERLKKQLHKHHEFREMVKALAKEFGERLLQLEENL